MTRQLVFRTAIAFLSCLFHGSRFRKNSVAVLKLLRPSNGFSPLLYTSFHYD
eukprot:UN02203